MVKKFLAAALLFSFSNITLANTVSPNLEAWQTLINSSEFTEKTAGEEINSITLTSQKSVSTTHSYEFTINTRAAGLSFPDASPSSAPCFISAKVKSIGGVVKTDWFVDVTKVCALNSISF